MTIADRQTPRVPYSWLSKEWRISFPTPVSLGGLANLLGSVLDGQVHKCGEQAENACNRPRHGVGADTVVDDAAKPRTKERANLVRQEGNTEQRSEIPDAEHASNNAAGEWHRGQPGQPHHGRK